MDKSQYNIKIQCPVLFTKTSLDEDTIIKANH